MSYPVKAILLRLLSSRETSHSNGILFFEVVLLDDLVESHLLRFCPTKSFRLKGLKGLG